ncbi:BON domain-containing protein [Marinobacter panjinensis]|uniref:BON domain-containing protein n=1 Tax=Marinobacter panjinensis TaxID=2576384 RepID=A0A4U6R0B4_9GAMM|nr:BON domain-containing protein [Marinobacter panjinensis]MCR8915496.1 BON domain-containing protein [Marinobacter panjinensis]TKV66749.1 BON domain-containing protein [Marinobacter panjinensis]
MSLTTMKAEARFLVLWLTLVSGCSVFDGSGMATQDTAEAVRLKAVLLEADDLAGSAIDITIVEGEILLEGFVETTTQRQRAEDLMRENSKLDGVNNQIVVK